MTALLFQNHADLFIRHKLRVGQIAFQCRPSGTEPVRPFLPNQRPGLMGQALFLQLGPAQLLFRFFYFLTGRRQSSQTATRPSALPEEMKCS